MDSVEPSFINRVRPPSPVGPDTGTTVNILGEWATTPSMGFFKRPEKGALVSKACPEPVEGPLLRMRRRGVFQQSRRGESNAARLLCGLFQQPRTGRVRSRISPQLRYSLKSRDGVSCARRGGVVFPHRQRLTLAGREGFLMESGDEARAKTEFSPAKASHARSSPARHSRLPRTGPVPPSARGSDSRERISRGSSKQRVSFLPGEKASSAGGFVTARMRTASSPVGPDAPAAAGFAAAGRKTERPEPGMTREMKIIQFSIKYDKFTGYFDKFPKAEYDTSLFHSISCHKILASRTQI